MKPTYPIIKVPDGTKPLKALLLMCALLTMSTINYAQEYYYYYKGEKQPLSLNTEYVYLVASSEVSDSSALRSLVNKGAIVEKFDVNDVTKTLKSVGQSTEGTKYWAEIKLQQKLSEKEYSAYLKELKAFGAITHASPYFSNANEDKIGLSEYFYVKLRNEKDFGRLSKLAVDLRAEVVGQNKFMPLWYTLKTNNDSKLNALEMANRFYESKMFEHSEPDLMVDDLEYDPNDPLFTDQWGLENTSQYGGTAGIDINALDAWEISKGSRDVIVAVLDHGFEMNHPDLQGNTFGTGFDSESGTTPALVLGSHGTACAGIIGALQDNNTGVSGVAPNSQLMSISNSLVGSPNSRQKRADGINWAWQNGADIISNSWGSGVQYAIIDNAITNALNNGRGGLGTIIVFAAGNSNNAVSYPANSNPDIIAVGAADDCGLRVDPTGGSSCLSWNSFQGSCFGAQLDVMGPGAMISTTDRQGGSGYDGTDYTASFGGTSSACPMVAGVAALILSVNPCLTHDEVEDIIEQTAQKVGGYAYANVGGRPNGTWHTEMGYGLVDAEAAVLMAQSMLPNNFSFDIYSKDRPFDTGVEPNPDGGPMWISEDIWVRQNLDGGITHQNPEFKLFSPNGVYVKITNRSSTTSDCSNLSLYFSKASTGLVWPTHWDDYNIAGVLNGDKVNTVSIPAIAPGASEIIEIPWYPPNPADFSNDVHHFCLLARIESPSDPMFNEQNGVGVSGNVRRNNNIVWKNISVYDNDVDFMSLFVRGIIRGWSNIDLVFHDQGFKEEFRKPFFERGGEIFVRTEPEFFERIQKAKLEGVEIIDENMLHIARPGATIHDIPVYSKETFSMDLAFKVEVSEEEREGVILDVLQIGEEKELQGGERFVIKASSKDNWELKKPTTIEKSQLVYPNPSTGQIYIKYNIPSDNVPVSISLQNVLESIDRQLYKGQHNRGEYVEQYDVSRLKDGVYILTLKIGDKIQTERIVIDKD
ncbi:T9SS type A sorting domain-containing protein [Fulvivirga sp. RKSG066]|uniref:S8 family serine peptidase n=1 Tax=Fulvivirga aurantia TaxID=2529383 RepID=UPI0012BBC3F4|nr:S8 family serine peptidase [Fulvivirga aurantia]MTI22300.1 T9SS type A sorting domain-containing protein [Fulvivirga aurantia]